MSTDGLRWRSHQLSLLLSAQSQRDDTRRAQGDKAAGYDAAEREQRGAAGARVGARGRRVELYQDLHILFVTGLDWTSRAASRPLAVFESCGRGSESNTRRVQLPNRGSCPKDKFKGNTVNRKRGR